MHKKANLLLYLQKNPGWHTAQELAIELGLSKRTIKNYVQQLRNENIEIGSSVKGYQLSECLINKNNRGIDLPNTNEERVNFIINFLITSSSWVNLYDLAEMLFVSESTVIQNLKDAQHEVERFGIKLDRKGDYWSMNGDERQKRSLLSSLIYQESSGIFMNQNIIQNNFPQIKIHQLEKAILNIFHQFNIYLNTFELNNILLHLAIAIDRSSQGYKISYYNSKNIKSEEFGLKIVNKLIHRLKLNLSEADCQELALVIETDLGNENTAKNMVSVETKTLVKDLIKYVWQNYAINLDTETFKKRFSLHLDRLIMRSRSQGNEHNPISANIKFSSPTIYECAVIMAHRISEKAKITINDSEIGYIALHVGNAIAEQITDKQKVSVVIIIPKYYDNSIVFLKSLQKKFSSEINIKKVVHDPSKLKFLSNSFDLLISVGSNYIDPKINTVNISQFLLPNDVQALNVAITAKRHQLKKDQFQEQLLHFFSSDNFICCKKIKNINQVFQLVAKKLFKQGVVDKNFEKLLMQREQMSSTAFGKVAIPHTLNMTAKKSRGFIIINPNGIKWSDGSTVYLVIALAIDPDNKQLFRSVFDNLSGIVTNINNIAKLINCNIYSEFIVKLVEQL